MHDSGKKVHPWLTSFCYCWDAGTRHYVAGSRPNSKGVHCQLYHTYVHVCMHIYSGPTAGIATAVAPLLFLEGAQSTAMKQQVLLTLL